MTAVGYESLDRTVQLTHAWINELNGPVGWESKAYRLPRTVIQWPDWLSIDDAANLGVQLSALLGSIHCGHRRPATTLDTERHRQNFLVRIDEAFRTDPLRFTSEVSALFELLTNKVAMAKIDKVRPPCQSICECCGRLHARQSEDAMPEAAPDLSISSERLRFIGTKPLKFDVKHVVTTDPRHASTDVDDAMLSVLEADPDDGTVNELTGFIRGLTEDDHVDLVTLTWLCDHGWHGGLGGAASRSRARPQQLHRGLSASALRCFRTTWRMLSRSSAFPAMKIPEELRQPAPGKTSWPKDPSPASGSAWISLCIQPNAALRSRI
jgi:uncharacterized protein (DUF2267 family)